MQMPQGRGGALVDSVEECAAALLRLLGDRELARKQGSEGREWVRERFLLPRMLLDELRLLSSLHTPPAASQEIAAMSRDGADS
jgi:trehalose synthase